MTRTDALKQFLADCPELTVKMMAEICGKSIRAVESWLWDSNREVDSYSLYLIFLFCRKIGKAKNQQAIGVARKDEFRVSNIVAREKIGGVDRSRKKYLYHGEYLSIMEISSLSGVKYSTVWQRIAGIIDDVTDVDLTDVIDNVPVKTHKNQKFYTFRGEKKTLPQIAVSIGVSYNSLYSRLRDNGNLDCDDLTYFIDSSIWRKNKKRNRNV